MGGATGTDPRTTVLIIDGVKAVEACDHIPRASMLAALRAHAPLSGLLRFAPMFCGHANLYINEDHAAKGGLRTRKPLHAAFKFASTRTACRSSTSMPTSVPENLFLCLFTFFSQRAGLYYPRHKKKPQLVCASKRCLHQGPAAPRGLERCHRLKSKTSSSKLVRPPYLSEARTPRSQCPMLGNVLRNTRQQQRSVKLPPWARSGKTSVPTSRRNSSFADVDMPVLSKRSTPDGTPDKEAKAIHLHRYMKEHSAHPALRRLPPARNRRLEMSAATISILRTMMREELSEDKHLITVYHPSSMHPLRIRMRSWLPRSKRERNLKNASPAWKATTTFTTKMPEKMSTNPSWS